MKILLDYRERAIKRYFPEAEIITLDIGDIVCGQVCIERKTKEDFIASVIDNRIFNQALNLRQFEKPFIVVESDLSKISQYVYYAGIKINMEQITGVVASIMARYGVPVIFTSTRTNFVKISRKLLEKGNDDKSLPPVIKPVKKQNANPKLQALLAVPGIGEKKAQKILDYYKEFGNITIWDRPDGVSKKDIEKVLEVLK